MVESVIFDEEEGAVVASVRARKGATRRCGVCSRRCPWEDRGEGRRRWRAHDLGCVPVYLEADAPRVRCPDHGVVVVALPGPGIEPGTPGCSRTRWRGSPRTAAAPQ